MNAVALADCAPFAAMNAVALEVATDVAEMDAVAVDVATDVAAINALAVALMVAVVELPAAVNVGVVICETAPEGASRTIDWTAVPDVPAVFVLK